MRIISGEARGRTLFAPKGAETRPTSDKIRGSLFNIIASRVIDARVLDLFGGTGALALEALSRGAAFAVVSDSARAAIQAIERNARAVLKDDFDARIRILRMDYRAAIDRLEGSFDLVFLDPPYRMGHIGKLLPLAAAKLREGGTIICEYEKEAGEPEAPEGTVLRKVYRYGKINVALFVKPADDGEESEEQ